MPGDRPSLPRRSPPTSRRGRNDFTTLSIVTGLSCAAGSFAGSSGSDSGSKPRACRSSPARPASRCLPPPRSAAHALPPRRTRRTSIWRGAVASRSLPSLRRRTRGPSPARLLPMVRHSASISNGSTPTGAHLLTFDESPSTSRRRRRVSWSRSPMQERPRSSTVSGPARRPASSASARGSVEVGRRSPTSSSPSTLTAPSAAPPGPHRGGPGGSLV